MSEVQAQKKKPNPLKWAIGAVALLGAAAILYVIVSASFKPAEPGDLREFQKGELAKLVVPGLPTPKAVTGDGPATVAPPAAPFPQTPVIDASGKTISLDKFKGEIVVLNLWATWCGPCKTEMPTLAKLQQLYAMQPVRVVAVSVDRPEDAEDARAFIAAHGPLELYRDPTYKLAFDLKPRALGFPTTVIYDRKGIERARLSGGADWSGPEARALIERLLQEK